MTKQSIRKERMGAIWLEKWALLSIIVFGVTRAEECECPPLQEPVCCNDGFTYENQFCLECINNHPDFIGQREPSILYFPKKGS